jgi:hypothetical protein
LEDSESQSQQLGLAMVGRDLFWAMGGEWFPFSRKSDNVSDWSRDSSHSPGQAKLGWSNSTLQFDFSTAKFAAVWWLKKNYPLGSDIMIHTMDSSVVLQL